jgi:integrase
MMLTSAILAAGIALRVWNGGNMRRRFQALHVSGRGSRRKVWVVRHLEPILVYGQLKSTLRSRVLGACSEMSKSEARTVLQTIPRPLNDGVHTPLESVVFSDFFTKWERNLLPTFRETTRAFYRATAKRWIYPYFHDWHLREIGPAELQQFMNLFAGKYSRSVIKYIRATLACLFETAITWRYMKENPAAGLRLPEGKPVKRAPVLTPELIAMVLGELREPYRTMVLIGCLTAMRPSEILGLRWDDIDAER